MKRWDRPRLYFIDVSQTKGIQSKALVGSFRCVNCKRPYTGDEVIQMRGECKYCGGDIECTVCSGS